MKEQLYVVAASALKLDPGIDVEKTPAGVRFAFACDGTGSHGGITAETIPDVVWAKSEDEAVELGLVFARETWPASEGWISHTAHVREVDPIFVVESAAKVEAMMKPEDTEEQVM